jgi:cell wall-active antibiotic response 4TMS protein YvqF
MVPGFAIQLVMKRKKATMNESFDRHEARRQRREERREALGIPGGSTWGVGVVLIVLGGIFLMQNTGMYKIPFTNWWALFILIPAFGSLDRAYRAYKTAGNQLTAFARNSMFVGLILTMVAGMFLFNLNWTFFGPIMIILVGVGILANSMISTKE